MNVEIKSKHPPAARFSNPKFHHKISTEKSVKNPSDNQPLFNVRIEYKRPISRGSLPDGSLHDTYYQDTLPIHLDIPDLKEFPDLVASKIDLNIPLSDEEISGVSSITKKVNTTIRKWGHFLDQEMKSSDAHWQLYQQMLLSAREHQEAIKLIRQRSRQKTTDELEELVDEIKTKQHEFFSKVNQGGTCK